MNTCDPFAPLLLGLIVGQVSMGAAWLLSSWWNR